MASHLAAACFVAVPLPVARRVRGSVRLVAARLATVALAAVHSRLTWLARRLGSSAVQGLWNLVPSSFKMLRLTLVRLTVA